MAVYSSREELANVLTHAVGIALSVIGLFVLLVFSRLHGDGWHVLGSAVFGASLILVYATSTLYHACRTADMKRWLRKCDHAGIFLLIAGSYTPFLLVNLRGLWGWGFFWLVWGLGLIGVVLKFWFAGHFRVLSTLVYIAMGWMVLLALEPLSRALPPRAVGLLVVGGVSYTIGTVFYLWKQLPYHHAIWHVFVLCGSICHWLAVFRHVVPAAAPVNG